MVGSHVKIQCVKSENEHAVVQYFKWKYEKNDDWSSKQYDRQALQCFLSAM